MTSNSTEVTVRLQQIQYWISWLSAGFATGKWDSIFLGRGFEFQGVAPFRDDPDLVRLNWQATLISGELQVSEFSEERNINLYLLGDLGPSMAFGSTVSKQDRLALLSAVISFSAMKLKDTFRYIGYTSKVENGFSQTRDKTYPQVLAQAIMDFDTRGKQSSGLSMAALSVPSQRSMVFLVSDFLGDLEEIEHALQVLAPKHKVFPLVIWDEREIALPGKGWGLYPFADLTTGELSYVFLTPKNRKTFARNSRRREEALQELFRRYGIAPYFLKGGNPDTDIETLMKIFFVQRNRV